MSAGSRSLSYHKYSLMVFLSKGQTWRAEYVHLSYSNDFRDVPPPLALSLPLRFGCQNTIWLLGTFRLASSRISIQSSSKLDKGVLRSPIDKRPLLRRCSAALPAHQSLSALERANHKWATARPPACLPLSPTHIRL